MIPEVDWSKFNEFSEDTCTCRCGTQFRSHAKWIVFPETDMSKPSGGLVTRRPCPGCGRSDNLRGARSDPETFSIGG